MKKHKTIIFLTIILLVLPLLINAQNPDSIVRSQTIDSLLNLVKKERSDTNKVKHLVKLCDEYETIGEYAKGLLYGKQALQLANEIAKETKDPAIKLTLQKSISSAYINIGIIYRDQANYPNALKNYFASLKIRETLGDKKGISTAYNNIGIIFDELGNYPEALKNYFASLKIYEKIGDKQSKAASYNNIGIIYCNQGNQSEALKNFLKSLKIYEELKNKQGISDSYNNIGGIYENQGNRSEALKNYLASLKIREEIGDKQGIAASYNNIGLIYQNQGNYTEALNDYFASLKINNEIGDKQGLSASLINLGTIHTKLHKLPEAQAFLNKALSLSKEIGSKNNIKISYVSLAALDSTQGNLLSAYEHYKLFVIYKDSIDNEETKKKTIQSAMTYKFEKKEIATKAEQEKKDAVAAAESRKQKLVISFMIFGLLLVVSFAVYIFRSLRITRKQKNIIEKQKQLVDEKNNALNQQNEEIRTQRDEIEAQRDEITAQRDLVTQQKDHIEEIHQEVSDSINYAKRIQQAVLPTGDYAKNILGDHFILFKPKDIVSGDFYWATRVNEYLIITVADCTGHGVPGAFMSMLGISFLNEIVRKKEVTQASHVLDHLRDSVIDALKQQGSSGEQNISTSYNMKDGMDIALIVINTETMECQFAGANNPLWIVKSKKVKVETEKNTNLFDSQLCQQDHLGGFCELKGDKMPVAIYENMKPFTNNIIPLCKGDTIYLASDGYEDQFGGPKFKKFMLKQLKQLLVDNCNKPMQEQKEILDKTIEEWKNSYEIKCEQIDDITVLGIKI